MSEALPDPLVRKLPEPDARAPVSSPLHGAPPAWDPAAGQPLSVDQPVLKATEESPRDPVSESGDRSGMAETAERIGSVVGSAQRQVQRQVRRGIELVRRPASQIAATSSVAVSEAAESAGQFAHKGVDRASRVIENIEEEVSEARRQAARRLDELSILAGERFQELRRRARGSLSDSRGRAQELASTYPLQTIAAIAGACFALGVALRFRRSHRG